MSFRIGKKKAELDKNSLISNFAKLISEMLGHYRANGYTPQDLMARAGQLFEGERFRRTEVFIRIFYEISQRYERYLEEKQGIDFDEMISRSTKYVGEGRYTSPFTHILVDEFQDISEARAGLVKALRDQVPKSCLFCVGDDWQSIYQYAGSDINLMTDFERHFGDVYQCVLDRTFRFNNKIADISGRFVMLNPRQISKTITPHAQVDAARVFYAAHENDGEEEAILKILERIDNLREQEQESVLFLVDTPKRPRK
jgi:Superfamily I DNA and RNA helicases